VIDAVGPDRPTFIELVGAIREAVGSRARILRVPGPLIPMLSKVVGLVAHDVLLTRDEYRAMADGLADTDGPATGTTSLLAWIQRNADTLGVTYANELNRHFR
jgi:NADH dehydrogenase